MTELKESTSNFLLTFGYGNRRDHEEFVLYLAKFEVICVIDVRISPRAWSRKWYKDTLEKLCDAKGVQYISKVSLGNLSGCNHWVPPESEEAEQALSEVAKILEVGNVLLLCAEMDPSRCHRVEVASKLRDLTNASVKHLR